MIIVLLCNVHNLRDICTFSGGGDRSAPTTGEMENTGGFENMTFSNRSVPYFLKKYLCTLSVRH